MAILLTEQSATDAEENPHIDHEAKAKRYRNVQVDDWTEAHGRVGGSLRCALGGAYVGYDGTGESEEEKHCSPDELAEESNEVCD